MKELWERIIAFKEGRFHNHAGSFPLNLLFEKSKEESLVRLYKRGKLLLNLLNERSKWVRWLRLLIEDGILPTKPLDLRFKNCNLVSLVNSVGNKDSLKLL